MEKEKAYIKDLFRKKTEIAVDSFAECCLTGEEGDKWGMSVPFKCYGADWHVHFTNLQPGTTRYFPRGLYVCLEDVSRAPFFLNDYHCFNLEDGEWSYIDARSYWTDKLLDLFSDGIMRLRTEALTMKGMGFEQPPVPAPAGTVSEAMKYSQTVQVRGKVCKLSLTRTLRPSPGWGWKEKEAVVLSLDFECLSLTLNIGKRPVDCLKDYFTGRSWLNSVKGATDEYGFALERLSLKDLADVRPPELFSCLPYSLRAALVELK